MEVSMEFEIARARDTVLCFVTSFLSQRPPLGMPESSSTGNARVMDIEWSLLSHLSQQVNSTRYFYNRGVTSVTVSRTQVNISRRQRFFSLSPSRLCGLLLIAKAPRKYRNAETRLSEQQLPLKPSCTFMCGSLVPRHEERFLPSTITYGSPHVRALLSA